MPAQTAQSAPIPSGDAGNNDIATILNTIQGRNQALQASGSIAPAVSQQAGTGSGHLAGEQLGSTIVQPTLPQQPGAWATPGQQTSHNAQKRADVGTLINNIGNLIQTAANNKNQHQLAAATNNWNRLMTAMKDPTNPQNKIIIESILSDPKTLKQMSKALHIDWLNPAKGADNVYRQTLTAAVQKHQLKEGALGKLKDMLLGNQQDVSLNPQQKQQLASQMEKRFPVQTEPSAQVADQLKTNLLQSIMKDPAGPAHALQNMSEDVKSFIGVGASANAELMADTRLQIAQAQDQAKQAALTEKSKEFDTTINQRITDRTQRAQQFQATQQRLGSVASQNFVLKMQQLHINLRNAATAQQRLAVSNEIAKTGRAQIQMKGFTDQLTTIDKQIAVLTNQEKAIMTANKTQPGALGGIFEKDTGVSTAGQSQVSGIETQIAQLNSQKASVLTQQNTYLDQLTSSVQDMVGSGGNNAGGTGTSVAPSTSSPTAKTSSADPLGIL